MYPLTPDTSLKFLVCHQPDAAIVSEVLDKQRSCYCLAYRIFHYQQTGQSKYIQAEDLHQNLDTLIDQKADPYKQQDAIYHSEIPFHQ